MQSFRHEFQAILADDKEAESPDAPAQEAGSRKAIANKMLAGFMPLVGSGKPGDTGTFTMGHRPTKIGMGEPMKASRTIPSTP